MAPRNQDFDAATELVIAMHESLVLIRQCAIQAEQILAYLDGPAVEEESGWYAFGRLAEMVRTHLDTERDMVQRVMDTSLA